MLSADCKWELVQKYTADSDKAYYEVHHVTEYDGVESKVTVFSEKEGPVLFIGNGKLKIWDYRGEFWQDDYTGKDTELNSV